jgi:hypothetical protein
VPAAILMAVRFKGLLLLRRHNHKSMSKVNH